MLKTKRHIALLFSSLAMMAVILHGILPHHHHNTEAEKCNVEKHFAAIDQTDINAVNHLSSISSCCEDHPSNADQAQACTLNVAASKQVSVELIAIIKSITFQNNATQTKTSFAPVSDLFTPSTFSEIRSLRAPPLA